SAMNHDEDNNAVGTWLLGELAAYLADGPRPTHSLTPAMIESIRSKIMESKIDLSKSDWAFRPDRNNVGATEGWHEGHGESPEWTPIRIDRAWEGQGHANLDGWAWYRLTVDVPADFTGQEGYLQFTGVDDYYELFVNGVKAGTGGDIATKQTAFEERKSHRITPWIQPGQPLSIAIRVYDWYGAGGIFRPIYLTTAAETQDLPSFIK
ncbi:MAG: sugar-binding domain-containing protein, partial [Planctomycetaceae bacterium]